MKPYVRKVDLKRLAKRFPERTKSGLYVFYKVVRGKSRGSEIFNPESEPGCRDVRYLDGEVIVEDNIDRTASIDCGKGLNVLVHAPKPIFYREGNTNALLLQVLVKEDDIACVPSYGEYLGTHKLRVRQLLVTGVVKEGLSEEEYKKGKKWALTWKNSLKT